MVSNDTTKAKVSIDAPTLAAPIAMYDLSSPLPPSLATSDNATGAGAGGSTGPYIQPTRNISQDEITISTIEVPDDLAKPSIEAIDRADIVIGRNISRMEDDKDNALLNLPPPVPFDLKVENLWVGVPKRNTPSCVFLFPFYSKSERLLKYADEIVGYQRL
jgi:hypothetical protein